MVHGGCCAGAAAWPAVGAPLRGVPISRESRRRVCSCGTRPLPSLTIHHIFAKFRKARAATSTLLSPRAMTVGPGGPPELLPT